MVFINLSAVYVHVVGVVVHIYDQLNRVHASDSRHSSRLMSVARVNAYVRLAVVNLNDVFIVIPPYDEECGVVAVVVNLYIKAYIHCTLAVVEIHGVPVGAADLFALLNHKHSVLYVKLGRILR